MQKRISHEGQKLRACQGATVFFGSTFAEKTSLMSLRAVAGNDYRSQLGPLTVPFRISYFENFEKLVLGHIEAEFLQIHTHSSAHFRDLYIL